MDAKFAWVYTCLYSNPIIILFLNNFPNTLFLINGFIFIDMKDKLETLFSLIKIML